MTSRPSRKAPSTADGGQDVLIQPWILREGCDPLLLVTLDELPVLGGAARALVEAPGLEQLDVADPGDALGDLVAEVRVSYPADRALRDRLDDRARVLDRELFALGRCLGTADPAGVHQVDLERPRAMQLEEAIALLLVTQREEGVGARHPQGLAHLVLAACRRPLRLAQHEVV